MPSSRTLPIRGQVEAAAASAGARPEPAALPDSAIKHLGATTNPVQFYFDLLQPAAEQVLPVWMAGFSDMTQCVAVQGHSTEVEYGTTHYPLAHTTQGSA